MPPDVPRMPAGMAPGGLVSALIIEGRLVDAVPLLIESMVERVATEHAELAIEGGGYAALFDGDSGALVRVMVPVEGKGAVFVRGPGAP